jgi:uncharacterized membrane-anchored protein
MNQLSTRALPADDADREVLHNEVHARPTTPIEVPGLVVYVAVRNSAVSRQEEWAHLKQLPGQADLPLAAMQGNFLRIQIPEARIQWERHTEFTRYTIVVDLPESTPMGPELFGLLPVSTAWLSGIPGQTFCAIKMAMLPAALDNPQALYSNALPAFRADQTIASLMGRNTHSMIVTDFALREDGFEHMLVLLKPGSEGSRAGRIAQRLLELETYRLMALRGLPVAKMLSGDLNQVEQDLSQIMSQLNSKEAADQALLDALVGLAARIEQAMTLHAFRFSATKAYEGLVTQRITELREVPVSGIQTIGEFMQRRVSPAMATVASTSRRLHDLSERVSRTSELLRTRVDIATEEQNSMLLEKLTKGQELQLRLQSTVEGLSIAAISYYVVSLVLYGAKALKGAGVPIQPEMAAGLSIPLVLWVVWRTIRKIHAKLQQIH